MCQKLAEYLVMHVLGPSICITHNTDVHAGIIPCAEKACPQAQRLLGILLVSLIIVCQRQLSFWERLPIVPFLELSCCSCQLWVQELPVSVLPAAAAACPV